VPASDGGIYVAGQAPGSRAPGVVVRITPAGALDPSFGERGVLTLPLRSVDGLEPHAGGLLVVGMRPGTTRAALYRYDAAGRADDGFGGGRGFFDVSDHEPPFDVATERRGRIWINSTDATWYLQPDGQHVDGFRIRSSGSTRGRIGWIRAGDTRLLPIRGGALVIQPGVGYPRMFAYPISADGQIGDPARFRAELGGGHVPITRTRDEGTMCDGVSPSRESIARRPDGSIIVAGRVSSGIDFSNPALIALRENAGLERPFARPTRRARIIRGGRALDRRFGRATGAPKIRLVSTRRLSKRELLVRVRGGTRGVARLTLRLDGRKIARRMLAFRPVEPSEAKLRMFLTPTGLEMLRDRPRRTATLHVAVNDMAGNVRRTRFGVRL
jgi:Domain of unknown function (DUF5122) beta-propeller